MSLIFDWETRSPADLRNRGVYVYAEHPETDALLASFKLSVGEHEVFNEPTRAWIAAGGPLNVVCRWRRPDPCPAYLRAYVEAGGEVCAFNAGFERLIWWNVATPKYGWPKPRLEQFRCTAVTAAAMALPRSLDRLGDALGLKIKKDKAGSGLIKIHSVPMGFDHEGKAIWLRWRTTQPHWNVSMNIATSTCWRRKRLTTVSCRCPTWRCKSTG